MNLSFGQWPLGLDNRTEATRLPAAALALARDVLVETGGRVQSAQHPELALPLAGLSSLWTASNGQCYALAGDQMVRLEGQQALPLGTLAGSGAAGFAEFAGALFASRRGGALVRVADSSLHAAALYPPVFSAAPTSSGGLGGGRYGLCLCALQDGEEMGCSALTLVTVAEGGGIAVTVSGSGTARLFVTEPNGVFPLFAADIAAGVPFTLGAGKRGQAPKSRYLEPLPAGRFLCAQGGRLYSAGARHLYYSEPLRAGLADLRHNHIALPSSVSLLAAVADGLYVGDRSRVWFIEGSEPSAQALRPLSVPPPPAGCFAVLSGALFDELPDAPVAVWLGSNGFVLGLSGGQCLERQAARLHIPPASAGSLACVNRRLFALTY